MTSVYLADARPLILAMPSPISDTTPTSYIASEVPNLSISRLIAEAISCPLVAIYAVPPLLPEKLLSNPTQILAKRRQFTADTPVNQFFPYPDDNPADNIGVNLRF